MKSQDASGRSTVADDEGVQRRRKGGRPTDKWRQQHQNCIGLRQSFEPGQHRAADKAKDQDDLRISSMASEAIYIPDNATVDDALQIFLKKHQQLGIAVDEFGTISGVITMEDVIEHIIGQEIFEDDDPAIDMRELARRQQFASKHKSRKGEH